MRLLYAAAILTLALSYTLVPQYARPTETSHMTCFTGRSSVLWFGDEVVVSGELSPAHIGVNVTLNYLTPNKVKILRQVTTSRSGRYCDRYLPNVPGSWTVTASWPGDSDHSGASSPTVSFTVQGLPAGTSRITCSVDSSVTFVGRNVKLRGHVTPPHTTTVSMEYSFDNGKSWNMFAALATKPDGSFEAVWTPTKEGLYLLRSVWYGNAHLRGSKSRVARVQVRGIVSLPISVKQSGQASWTFMAYLAGDNDLGSNPGGARYDEIVLNQMASVGSTTDVNIIVLWDTAPTPSNPTKILYVRNESFETKKNYAANINTATPSTLTDFISWTVQNYPAQRYALVLWNHGAGFRGLCWDNTARDYMTMRELSYALANSQTHFDMIGFDACMMGMSEVAYQIRSQGDFMVGSEESGTGSGWPYDTVLGELVASPNMSGADLSQTVVTKYSMRYSNIGFCTMAAENLTYSENLGYSIDRFAEALEGGLVSHRPEIEYAYLNAEWYLDVSFIDIYDFAQLISENVANESIRTAAQNVMLLVQNMVISEWHNYGHPNSHGLSIYGEWRAAQYDWTYDGLDLSTEFVWNGFVRKYVGLFDFRVTASPVSQTVVASQKAIFTVNVLLYSPPSRAVSLNLSGLPTNVGTYSFSLNSGDPAFESTLTVATNADAPNGTYSLIVTGTGDGVKRNCEVTVAVERMIYSATITAYCLRARTFINVKFTWNGIEYTTPRSFNLVSGSHTVVMSSSDSHGHSFSNWADTSSTSPSRLISSGGTYQANYGSPFPSGSSSRLTWNSVPESSPSISGDGQWIAFISRSDASAELYVISGDGLSLRRLTWNSVPESSPSISGDGQWIAFISGSGTAAELYVIKSDGTNLRRLTWNSVPESSPSISGDGQWIAFISGSDASAELYVIRSDVSSLKRLTWNPFVPESSPSISANGGWVAYIYGSGSSAELWVYNIESRS